MRYMKLLVLVAGLLMGQLARATDLPDACGDDKVKFDVSLKKNQPKPDFSDASMAQIVFVENFDQNLGLCVGCKVTTRVGMDGKWVGANEGNSYFAIPVAPGDHHVCVDWQSTFGNLKQKAGLVSFTAEAGKVYYFETHVQMKKYDQSGSAMEKTLDLAQVSDDEGKYRAKISPLSVSKPKH